MSSYSRQYCLHIAWYASHCSLWDILSGFRAQDIHSSRSSQFGSEPIFSSYLTGPISPLRSPEEEPVIIYQTKVESRCEKDTSPERPRSPPSVSDPNPPVQNRRDRLSRFDPGSEKANGLPAKPTTAPADPSANFSHLTEIQLERRSNPHSSPMQIRAPEPPLTYPSNNERGRGSPARSENPVPAPCK